MIILITFLPIEIKHISVTKVLLPFNWDVSGLETGRIQIRLDHPKKFQSVQGVLDLEVGSQCPKLFLLGNYHGS